MTERFEIASMAHCFDAHRMLWQTAASLSRRLSTASEDGHLLHLGASCMRIAAEGAGKTASHASRQASSVLLSHFLKALLHFRAAHVAEWVGCIACNRDRLGGGRVGHSWQCAASCSGFRATLPVVGCCALHKRHALESALTFCCGSRLVA